ncbi:MAG: OmpA family protein [Spirochaetia bacterium]|nr:OmpA family protein [Spirochaetia bacterium]
MARKNKVVEPPKQSGESGSGRWMLTYLDMVTLLFGVFVILYAMSQVDQKKMQAVAESIRMGFQGGRTMDEGMLSGGRTILEDLFPEGVRARHVKERITGLFRQEILTKLIKVTEDERGIVVSLVGMDNFRPGSAELTDETQELLEKMSLLLTEVQYPVRIEGHTDDEVQDNNATAISASDWELGAKRSVNVILFLETRDVDPHKLSAVSFGSTRPVDRDGTPESHALNRRIDIIIVTGDKIRMKEK